MKAGASVEFRNVRQSYPEANGTPSPVVENFNLNVMPGEFVSLLGPSGCGKSTLLRLIAGLTPPSSGDVRVESDACNYFRAFVFQEAQLLPWRNVLENAMLPLELTRQMPIAQARKQAREALIKVGLQDALEKFPSQLSGGMKMRVSVARALVAQPRLLLLDEPFAALDEAARFRLQEDLRELWREQRMTVVFVTHSVSEAAFLSQRAVVLSTRPARILLDRPSGLGDVRSAGTREEAAFVDEIRAIGRAFRAEEPA